MNKYIATICVLVLLALAVKVVFLSPVSRSTLGSVSVSNEYYATSTKGVTGTALTDRMLKTNTSGALGSVVITGAAAGKIDLYDATSTTDSGKALLVTIPASTAAGTYTFDASFYRGLLLDVDATVPTSTITWR